MREREKARERVYRDVRSEKVGTRHYGDTEGSASKKGRQKEHFYRDRAH